IALSNARGTVGLSTRGLNTGDAQFYINLVDNRRLDDDYTVFARVIGMEAVEQIEQGEQIVRINLAACPSSK
ncbi:MAG TPA: peptidylprolyl isomerase, partial [Vicinamibacterales bacterium]